MQAIDGEDLKRVEADVDAWRDAIPSPPWGLGRAQWNLLAVIEDMFRLRLHAVQLGNMEAGQYLQLIDDYKFVLKYSLAHVARLPPGRLRERPDLNDVDEWGGAEGILEAHTAFNDAMAAFSGAKAGAVRCFREDSGRYWFRGALGFERQANDALESRTASSVTPLILMFKFLFANDEELPKSLAACVKRLRSSTGERRPRIDDDILDELDAVLGTRRLVIPETWTSSLGTAAELARSFRNLWLVAVAHVVAITNSAFGNAHREAAPGLNVRWLLGEVTPKWLVGALTRHGGVSVDGAKQLIELLTYGAGTKFPDPALQFLFPLRDGLIAIPWFFYLTCNAERNLLALMARVRKKEFNAASAAFEQGMIQDVRTAVRSRNWACRFNTNVPAEGVSEEVDVILLDREECFALVVEMRWFLEPSEVGEVAEREAAGAQKAEQARRKSAAVSRVIETLALQDGISTPGDWTIDQVAVFDNYLPTPKDADVPFVSYRAFASGIHRFRRVRDLARCGPDPIPWTPPIPFSS